MVPVGYLVVAGVLAGLAALRNVAVSYFVARVDGATAVAGYSLATAWVAFLLVPVCAVGVGYAGGRAADGSPEPVRSGAVCFGVGLVASAVAVGVALAASPGTAAQGLPFRAASFALAVFRAATVAAVAVVAGAAVAGAAE